jgi:hypothetical protein
MKKLTNFGRKMNQGKKGNFTSVEGDIVNKLKKRRTDQK